MNQNTYTLIGKFECCGVTMATVIIDGKAACIMTEKEYNKIIETGKKFEKKNKCKIA